MGMEAAAALGRGDPFTLATASPGGGIELYLQQDDAHHAAAAISAAPETQQQRVGPQGSGAPGVKQPQRHQHQHQRDVRGTQSELTSAAAPQDGNHLQQQQDGRRGPPTEERLRIREKYRERLKERKLQIYQRALEEVIQREKEGSQMQLVFQLQLPTRFGENVYMVGNEACVGRWRMEDARPMHWSEGNVWSTALAIPNGLHRLEYKYIIKEGSRVTWEPGKNHIWGPRSPMGALASGEPITICDSWGGGLG
ncbi:uncharacterized protein LOC113146463 [Cyclospora cayetanensis]|uniref:Uncharacterized protein LOC113146463 n=1 Tax=Cyclospora cayetanensis TaxID=88456 RepID=A0A6P6RQ88_9EIME|nr:uncharacterized protein LOC113146463 [Cyclospora cayetanensis]